MTTNEKKNNERKKKKLKTYKRDALSKARKDNCKENIIEMLGTTALFHGISKEKFDVAGHTHKMMQNNR